MKAPLSIPELNRQILKNRWRGCWRAARLQSNKHPFDTPDHAFGRRHDPALQAAADRLLRARWIGDARVIWTPRLAAAWAAYDVNKL